MLMLIRRLIRRAFDVRTHIDARHNVAFQLTTPHLSLHRLSLLPKHAGAARFGWRANPPRLRLRAQQPSRPLGQGAKRCIRLWSDEQTAAQSRQRCMRGARSAHGARRLQTVRERCRRHQRQPGVVFRKGKTASRAPRKQHAKHLAIAGDQRRRKQHRPTTRTFVSTARKLRYHRLVLTHKRRAVSLRVEVWVCRRIGRRDERARADRVRCDATHRDHTTLQIRQIHRRRVCCRHGCTAATRRRGERPQGRAGWKQQRCSVAAHDSRHLATHRRDRQPSAAARGAAAIAAAAAITAAAAAAMLRRRDAQASEQAHQHRHARQR
eukprot:1635203-Pleurochrysis_carterae.AAC.1